LHPSTIDPLAARWNPARWLGAGGALALACAAGVAVAEPAVDLALAGAAVVAGGAGAALAWRSAAARSLPLEIAPLALGGEVDALPVVRLRARLGLGRAFRDARARVWLIADGAERELPARCPPGTLVGAFTVVASDPERRVRPGDRVRIELTVTSAGAPWSAVRELEAPSRTGRFTAPGWIDAEPPEPGGAC
jgi:hypothetical protein